MLVRDHRERLEGFVAVTAEEFPSLSILPVIEGRDDPEMAHMLVADALSKKSGIIGVYSLGAGNRGLIRALAAAGRTDVCVIAHELTAETRAGLESGLVDAVLNQDAGHEVRSAVRVLRAKADGLPVNAAQERIRLDIFIRDNLPAEPDAVDPSAIGGN
jgi:LacI family transcriptional regulator